MSTKELSRLEVLTKLKEKQLKQQEAARILDLSPRQIRRLLKRLEKEGPEGLVLRQVGAPSNNRGDPKRIAQILSFCSRKDHYDFGPTLVHEYLSKESPSAFSITSVRNVMSQRGLWIPKKKRELKIHPLRLRRLRKGELIQVDGSEHDWFEGRGPRCTLLVYIDDASSETMHLKFVKSENLFDYFDATREYIEKHGRPQAFYPDKHAVFRVNRNGALKGTGLTQFGRAMQELDIELICANSPQAKGRVERRNRDFQNRLVKAMRLAKICTIEAANAFLPNFINDFNQQFAKKPQDPRNAHRIVLDTQNLDRIFCLKEIRQLSKNLTLQYDNLTYQVIAERTEYALRKAVVTVLETKEGKVLIEHKGKRLVAVPYHQKQARTEVVSSKELLTALTERRKKKTKPKSYHPWKRRSRGFLKNPPDLANSY